MHLLTLVLPRYVEHTGEQQKEVMALMANMLDFDEAERYSVGLGQRRGFITQLFAGPAVKPKTPGKAAAPTFASDLVEFMMTEAQAEQHRDNPFDLTKVWSQKEYPLIDVGVVELNRNPDNYFAEVEQAAFSPASIVPGIGFSPDKIIVWVTIQFHYAHIY